MIFSVPPTLSVKVQINQGQSGLEQISNDTEQANGLDKRQLVSQLRYGSYQPSKTGCDTEVESPSFISCPTHNRALQIACTWAAPEHFFWMAFAQGCIDESDLACNGNQALLFSGFIRLAALFQLISCYLRPSWV